MTIASPYSIRLYPILSQRLSVVSRMSPDADYVIGHETGIWEKGNAPYLLWEFWSLELALLIPIILWSFPFMDHFPLTISGFFYVTLACLVIGLLIPLLFQIFIRFKFKNPYQHTELELLIDKAKNRMGYISRPVLWLYPSEKVVLVPVSALTYKAIVLTESAVNDLLASPVEGEIVIADVLSKIEGQSSIGTWLPIGFFVLFSLFIYPWAGLDTQPARSVLWIVYLIIVLLFGTLVVRPRKDKEDPVYREYSKYSKAARFAVFRNKPMTDSELEEITKRTRYPLPSPTSLTRRLISFVVASTLSFIVWILVENWITISGVDAYEILSALIITGPFLAAVYTLIGVSIGLDVLLIRGESNDSIDE